jgi:hypothetical protein
MQPPGWYLNRLRTMSAAEVLHRIRRKASRSLQRSIGTRTRLATADETAGFLWAPDGPPDLAARTATLYTAAADAILAGRLQIFELDDAAVGPEPEWNRDPRSKTLAPLTYGPDLDYRDERLVGDIKYVWELNRHLQWVTMAQAYRLSGQMRYLEGLGRQLKGWLEQCPYPLGVNWCSSLENAIRLMNWAWVWSLLGGRSAPLFQDERGRRLLERWLESVYLHLRFIDRSYSAHSSANNHLIGEAAGAFVGSSIWPCWPEAADWRARAHAILVREALLQNAPDGVNREQAFSYQQFVLDFLISAAIAGAGSGMPLPADVCERIETMVEFLAAVADGSGHVPMIGDADDGYVYRLSPEPEFDNYASLRNTAARLFGRTDLRASDHDDHKTAWLTAGQGFLRIPGSEPPPPRVRGSRAFHAGGYFVMAGHDTHGREIKCVVDAGPLGYLSIAAHGHADALSIVLSYDGKEVLVDPGTFAYHTQPVWRAYFRGTAAHNTVQIDGADQSQSGGNFMWLRHAKCRVLDWRSTAESDTLVAMHDGYSTLPDPVEHRRTVQLDKRAGRLVITDEIRCRAVHRADWHWHFAEGWRTALAEEGGGVQARQGRLSVRVLTDDRRLEMRCTRGGTNPPLGWISRRFGVREPIDTWSRSRECIGESVTQTTVSFGEPDSVPSITT